MKHLCFTTFSLIIACFHSGCAGVKFYSAKTAQADEEIAIKLYQAKPYILVTPPAGADKPGSTAVITLPDLANPIYVKRVSGFGTAQFNFTLTNGALTSWNESADSKTTELITSLTGGYGAVAAGIASLAEEIAAPDPNSNEMRKLFAAGSGEAMGFSLERTYLDIYADSVTLVVDDVINTGHFVSETHRLAAEISRTLKVGGP